MMKKIILIALLLVCFLLTACASGAENGESAGSPPAFDILQKQITLTKQGSKGESTSFTTEEFERVLGDFFTYITVKTLPDEKSGTLILNGNAVSEGQTLTADSLEFLKFLPSIGATDAKFVFTCDAEGFLHEDICCEIVFREGTNLSPVAADGTISTVSGICCTGRLSVCEPDNDDFTVNVVTYPRNGYISVDSDGNVVYTPENGFSGIDTMIYTVTDVFGAVSNSATLKIEVAKNESGIIFADMQESEMHLFAHRMCANNVMLYRSDGENYYFDPESTVTKLEFLVMLMNASGQDNGIVAVADSAAHDDTGLSSGLKGYLSAAAEKQIILLDNGNFLPNSPITVADAAYMVARVLNLPKSKSENANANASEENFSAMLAVSNAGLFDTIDPSKTLNKADTAELLCRVEDYMLANNMKAEND